MSKRALGLYSSGGCLAVAAVVVLINLLSVRYFFRLDFTEDRIYSLSPASKNILSRLTDPLRVRVFFDETVPVEYAHQRRYLSELLQEMSIASGGTLQADFADMKKPESREEAQRAGIAPLRFTVVREDKFEVQEGMMGLAIYYEDKKELIPAITQVSNLEYDLAGRIVKLTQKARPVIGWPTGNGEMSPPPALSRYLSQNYELVRLDGLDRGDTLPAVQGLVIAGPRRNYSETSLRTIDQAILSAIPTAILLDLYDVNLGNFFVRKNENGLDRLLQSYGLTAVPGLVADAQNVPIQMQTQQGFFTLQTVVNYPYIPRVTNLSKDHPVTRKLTEIALPFVTSLDVQDSAGVTVLAQSSQESYRMANAFMVSPSQQINVQGAAQGPFVLGVTIQGRRRSAFSNVPRADGDVRLLVLANANFLDEDRGGGPNNISFSANLIDWLAASEDLIVIRAKTNTYRPLEKVSDDLRTRIKAANLFLMPLIITLIGIVRWRIRRRRRRIWEDRASARCGR